MFWVDSVVASVVSLVASPSLPRETVIVIVSPTLPVVPADGDCPITRPFSTVSLFSYTIFVSRPYSLALVTASLYFIPLRSGTLNINASLLWLSPVSNVAGVLLSSVESPAISFSPKTR